MILQRYIVEVDSEQVLKLSDDQVALATQISNGATRLLIFRDRFVAFKVAVRSGGVLRNGRLVTGDEVTAVGTTGFTLGNSTLMLEQASAIAEA